MICQPFRELHKIELQHLAFALGLPDDKLVEELKSQIREEFEAKRPAYACS